MRKCTYMIDICVSKPVTLTSTPEYSNPQKGVCSKWLYTAIYHGYTLEDYHGTREYTGGGGKSLTIMFRFYVNPQGCSHSPCFQNCQAF